MASHDPIPQKDNDFDTLQAVLVAAVVTNAVTWNIPAGEITKLTTKQSVWAAAWLIAKNKKNATPAQLEAKDLARSEYEKVLRPFIQKWVYRNEDMDSEAVMECGLTPRDTEPTAKQAPETPTQITVKRGQDDGVLFPECKSVPGAESYICIAVPGFPLPEHVELNGQGQLIIREGGGPGNPTGTVNAIFDFTKSRRKKFTGLVPGTEYYFYFIAINSTGVSSKSTAVIKKC